MINMPINQTELTLVEISNINKTLGSLFCIITGLLSIYCFVYRYKYFKRIPTKNSINLLILFFLLPIIEFWLLMDNIFYDPNTTYNVRWGYILTLFFSIFSNSAIILFVIDIFYPVEEKIPRRIVFSKYFIIFNISIFSILGVFLRFLPLGMVIGIGLTVRHLFIFVFGMVGGISLLTYIITAVNSFITGRRIEDPTLRASIFYIGKFTIFSAGVYIFTGIDNFFTYYSIFYVISHICHLISIYFSYAGFVRPLKGKNGEADVMEKEVDDY